MDTKGARALADRIASGPPQEDGEEPKPAPRATKPKKEVEPQPEPSASSVETVYVKPTPGPRREVRLYVRGPNGELERRS